MLHHWAKRSSIVTWINSGTYIQLYVIFFRGEKEEVRNYREYTKDTDFSILTCIAYYSFMTLILVFLHSIFSMSSTTYQNLPILYKSWYLAYIYNLHFIVVLLPCLEEANLM